MVILRATNDNGTVVDLDVLESDQPILLDISAIENATIGDVFGVSSQTFSLPGTDKNNAFFGNLFNLGATPSVALQDSIPCQVLTDGQAVFTGRLYITDIITDQKGYTTYQVNIVNETVDFKFILTDTYLAELDWSAYNHTYNYGNITGSWDGNIANGDIVYPNVDYGRAEGDTTAPTYAFSNNLNSVTFDNSTLPLRVQDFKPAIRVRAVLDTIFSQTDYEYTSSFIDSAYFSNLYLLTTPSDAIGVQNENPTTGSFYAYRETSNQVFNALTDTLINFNTESFDDFNRYDLINDEYTTYAAGQYGFTVAFTFSISNYDIDNRLRFFVTLQTETGAQIAGRTFVDPPQSGQLIAPFPLVSLAAGKKVKVYVELFTDDGSEVVTIGPGQNATYFTLYSAPKSVFNTTVDMAEQFPSSLKALDFIQGLIEKFNLVIEPVPGTRNVLRIEPFQDWIDQGAQKDWTNKVDRSQRYKILHPITEQPKEILFSDEEDDDAINQYTIERFGGDVYGTYKFTNESDLAVGERKIGTTFAATPVKNIPNSTDFIIPMLHKREPGQEPRPYAFKPRLLYANGKKTVPADALGGSLGTNGAPPRGIVRGRYFFNDGEGTIHAVTSWFQMTTYEDLPTTNSSRDLHFGNRKNPGFWPYFQTNVNGYTANSAYHYYWETYINSLYDIDARKLVCNVFLEPNEIQNIALNDKYFIDGAYYRINKISGANLSYRDTVEVELIKQLNRKLIYPRRRVLDILNDRFVDIQVREEAETGRVVYQDYDGGLPVEDFGLIVQASAKDGYTVYKTGTTGSVAWNTIAASNIPLDRQVSAGNEVDQVVARVNVNGTANKLEQNVTDSNVLGTNNTIAAFTDTALVSGFDNVVDIDQSNVAIIAGTTSSILNGTDNSIIMGGSGSYINNGDWVMDINGFPGGITDSDNTVAINRAENEVIINGSGHTVLTLNLEGGGLDLLNTRNNSNWLGDTYLGEALFRERKQLECGDSVTFDLSDTQYKHDNLYILNWSGLSPGTTTITLPNAINNDYKNVVLQFQANGTFDGTTDVDIVGFSGQLINGVSTYTLNEAYSGVTLTTSGSGWIVLAAPSSITGKYGNFYNSSSQALVSATVSQSVTYSSTYPSASNGVFFASGSRIYFEDPGVYQFNWVAQLQNTDNAVHDAVFWVKYNGVDYPNSNTYLSMPARKSSGEASYQLMSAVFTGVAQNANDYIELYWTADDTAVSLFATGSNQIDGEPATPSIIANVISIGGAGGGGGSTPATASFAISASYAISASQAECANRITTYNSDQPEQGDIYYSTFVIGTGSQCDYLFTSELFAPYFVPEDNTIYVPESITMSGSFEGSFSGSFTGSITSASYAATASNVPNIYTADGGLTNNRQVVLDGNNLTFVADSGETFEIASDPASDVLISGLPQATGSNVIYYNTSNGKLTYGAAPSNVPFDPVTSVSQQMAGLTTDYVYKLDITSTGTYNVHVSQSGAYYINFDGLASGTSANVNFYYWVELLPTGSTTTIGFTANSGSGNFVGYRTLVTASSGTEWYSPLGAASIGSTTQVHTRVASSKTLVFPTSNINPNTMTKASNGIIYLNNFTNPIGSPLYTYTGNQGTAIP